jgi:hypothetical protein
VSYEQVVIPAFGGLNLVDQPGNVDAGQALDARDVVITERGRIERRASFGDLGAVNSTVRGLQATYQDGARVLLAGSDAALTAYSSALASLATIARTAACRAFCRYGQPGSERTYAFNGVDQMAKYAAGALTQPTITKKTMASGATTAGQTGPKAGCGCVWAGENRMVVGGFTDGTTGPAAMTSSPHHVWFSEPGDPETWGDTSFLRLSPGDGDAIVAVVAWRELVFVFKRDKFFVLTNTTVDGNGAVRFNYRAMDTGIGAVGAGAVAVGRDGVYFVGRNGLYRTRGDDPELLSRVVEPLWSYATAPFYTGGFIQRSALAAIELEWVNERLYMAFEATTSPVAGAMSRIAVYDIRQDWWSVWTPYGYEDDRHAVGPIALAAFRFADRDELLYTQDTRCFAEAHGTADVDRPIGRWLGGFSEDGASRVKRMAQLEIWGAGPVSVGVRRDFRLQEYLQTITIGGSGQTWNSTRTWDSTQTWPASRVISGQLVQRAQAGRWLAVELVGTSLVGGAAPSWAVARIVKHIAGVRPPSEIQQPV